jgi:choline/glycine/proline betaine transport protein
MSREFVSEQNDGNAVPAKSAALSSLIPAGLSVASAWMDIAIVVVALFFITSSDSGSLVIDMLANGGRTDTPVVTRVYWAVLEGLAAAVLLIAGGSAALLALQTAAIVTAAPISIVMAIACVSLLKALRYEVSTTPSYLRIVGGSEDLPLEVEPSGNGNEPTDSEMIVAFHDLSPAVVDFDPETGVVQLIEHPHGEDPLADLVGAEPRPHVGSASGNGR